MTRYRLHNYVSWNHYAPSPFASDYITALVAKAQELGWTRYRVTDTTTGEVALDSEERPALGEGRVPPSELRRLS